MKRERGVDFMVFALCGGDARTLRLTGMLVKDGHRVRTWALEDAPAIAGVEVCASARECCAGAECVILPMPATTKRGLLNAPYSSSPRCLGELFASLDAGTLVLTGTVTKELTALAEGAGVELRGYGSTELFRAANSLATAEGAIAVLLRETEAVLCGAHAVIIGAGAITRALAPRLYSLGVSTTIASRDAAKRAWYAAMGLDTVDTSLLATALSDAQIVINTAPSLVLTASRLTELPEGALVLDLASAPGGTDFDAARAYGIKAVTAPGLPGKYAPQTSAQAVRDAVYKILEDERLGKS